MESKSSDLVWHSWASDLESLRPLTRTAGLGLAYLMGLCLPCRWLGLAGGRGWAGGAWGAKVK
jgi:hypothetical protein